MEAQLIPIMNFSREEMLLMATGLSLSEHMLSGSRPPEALVIGMYSKEREVLALMEKLTQLLEVSVRT